MKVHPPGTRLGPFEVISYPVLSDVSIDYTCLDHERSCPTLLKTLRPELLQSQAARDCFAQSGAAWVDLGAHPHIVRCYDVFQPDDTDEAYLVLQAVVPEKDRDTASLLSWLVSGQPLPVLQALLFALQIARGMRHVTDKMPGFTHGDLKPESVLVCGGRLSQADVNRLRVTDFGLSALLRVEDVQLPEDLNAPKASVERTQLINSVVGTPLYMAPEQWRAETVRTATDVYALGCLLYRMLVGRHPVAGKTAEALQNAHTTGNVRPMPVSLPVVVRELASRCLALEPEERYQNWEALESDLSAVYEEKVGYPVPAAEPTDVPTEAERALTGWFFNEMGISSCETGKIDTAVACFEQAVKVGRAEGDRGLVGTATSGLGEAYRRLGDTARAINHHEQALAIAREIGDRSVEGPALNNMGTAYLQLSNPRRAIEYFEQALAIAREIGNRRGEMAALVNMGSIYHQLGDLRRSIEYYEQELKIARKTGERRGESTALANLGAVYLDLGDNRRAIEYQEQSLAIKSEIGDRYGQIAGLNNLGNAYRNLGRAPRAFEYYERALGIAREMGDRRGEAFALNNMGSTHSNLGNMQRALEYHEKALEIFREIGDKRSEGDCLTNLGYIYMRRRDTQRAIETCEQALAIDHEIGDMMGVALDSFNMANLLAQQGRFSDALSYAEESADILEKVGHTKKAPEARQLVAAIRAELDPRTSKEEAIATAIPPDIEQQILRVRRDNPGLTANMTDEDIVTLLQQADYALAKKRPITVITKRPSQPGKERTPADRPDLARQSVDELVVHGQKLMAAGQWQEAEEVFFTMERKAEQTNNTHYQSVALLFLGRIYTSHSEFTRAIESFGRALELAERIGDQKTVSVIYDAMGAVHEMRGSYQEAIGYYEKAIEICKQLGDEQGVVISRGNLGNVYRTQGDFEQAIEAYKEALEYYIGIGAQHAIAKTCCNLGLVYQQQGRYDVAIEMLQKSQRAASRLGDELTAAKACRNLGIVYSKLGNYPLAVEMHQEALAIHRRIGNKPGVGTANAGLALVYQMADDVERALSHYEIALGILKGTGDRRSEAETHFNMGILYREIRQPSKAREQYKKAQELFEALGDLQNAQRAAEESQRL